MLKGCEVSVHVTLYFVGMGIGVGSIKKGLFFPLVYFRRLFLALAPGSWPYMVALMAALTLMKVYVR